MARPRKSSVSSHSPALPPALASWAEEIGVAIGRGLARALNNSGLAAPGSTLGGSLRRRGRPPKALLGPVPPERRCIVPGCERESRSKRLCSAHYQAERRRQIAAKVKATTSSKAS